MASGKPRVLNLIDNIQSFIDGNESKDDKKESSEINDGQIVEIPSAATVTETVILDHKIDKVWNMIKDCTFEFSSLIKTSEIMPDKSSISSVGAQRKLTYNDGTTQIIQINEISATNRTISYSLISSEPR